VANAVAEALSERVSALNGATSRRIGVQVVDAAAPPARPASPRLFLNLVFGGLVGLLTGVGLALARERLDTRIRTAAQAERELGLPVLGVVPKIGRRIRRSEALARHAHHEVAEAYRSIAVALVGGAGRGPKQGRILVTSARPEEGKTTAAAHLALALAEDNRRIALIEGDLRRPSLRRHFPSDEAPELNDVLYRTPDWRLPASSGVCPGLKVLAAGESHTDVGLILRAPEFERTLEAAVADHDHVLLDAPPTLAVSDASVLARHADAVVIVVRAASTRAEDVRAAQAAFRRLGVDIAGVVLVGGRRDRRGRHYYGGTPSRLSQVKPLIHEVKPLSEVNEQ
jgi:receptor protein-tyrosine kinase